MPTISLNREHLFDRIGKKFTDNEFDELCFEFGIELDDVTSERQMAEKERATSQDVTSTKDLSMLSDEIIYKIEIPANRYDLLSLEGLSRAMRAFLSIPSNTLKQSSSAVKFEIKPAQRKMIIRKEVEAIRPHVVCAILRNVSFGQIGYESFIALQDKLHANVCRKRTLVSIGTHDLDKIAAGDIFYAAKAPKDISFQPLKEDKVFRADELMVHYEQDMYLKPYLHIIRDSPVYPVVLDSSGQVLSLPPIINSNYSKMTPETKNVFIEITATDLTKALTVLDILVCAFSEYTSPVPYTIEQVEVVRESNSTASITPQLSSRVIPISISYVNQRVGIDLKTADELASLLLRMGLSCEPYGSDSTSINVIIPPDRPDILHACDVMEDAAIAYGFNKVKATMPRTFTIASEQPLNKLSDSLRKELGFAGFTEILTLTLCSRAENYTNLNRSGCEQEAVVLANPQTVEFEIVRTSLIPGALKSIQCNKFLSLPMRIFEVADVVLLSGKGNSENYSDVGSRNERHLLAMIADSSSSGLEIIRGLLDRLITVLDIQTSQIQIRNSKDGAFFEGRQAQVFFNEKLIGIFGIVHPECLSKFDIPFAVSALELNIEPFL